MTVKINKIHLFLALLLLSSLSCGCSGSNNAAPLARHGVLDLSTTNMPRTEPVRLDGEWEFYWKQLLSPEDFQGQQAPPVSAYLTLPGSWTGFNLNKEKLSGEGFATFRLRILPGPGKRDLALQVELVNSAYKLWANNRLLVEGGVVGKNLFEEISNQSFQQVGLNIEDQPIDLVLQISNHHDREGGAVSSIKFGNAGTLEADQLRKRGLTLICIGSLMVMGMYHIVLFIFRTRNAAPLYFGIYCLLWMGFSLTSNSNGWLLRLFMGDIPPWLLNRIDLICIVVSVPIIYSFLRTLYPEEFALRPQHASWVVASVFTVLGILSSTMDFTSYIPIYYVLSMLLMCYSVVMLLKAIRSRREGAPYILLGFVVLAIAGFNDMLYDMQVIHSVYLMETGMLLFILFQAGALSLRFSKAFSSVEQLSGELTDKNLVLEQEINERNKLEREIVNISEEERRRISHELHDGLCQKLTGARLHFSVLERKLAHDGRQVPELTPVSSLLEESVNQAYDLSRGLWPVEFDPHGLSPSLEELTRRLAESSGITIEFSQERSCENCANAGMIQLYRIAQEAITNAVKHARPGRIVVGLHCVDRRMITLIVQDNGMGRSAAARTKGGLGMGIMAHRAKISNGELTIADAIGGGTLVSCSIPCTSVAAEV